jgi:hypothetical protein
VCDEFDRYEPLIVIWRNNHIELSRMRAKVEAVGGIGTRYIDVLCGTLPYSRSKNVDVLPAEHPTFPRMGIDPCDRDARTSEVVPAHF